MLRLIVAGGRDFSDYLLLREKLDFFLQQKRPEEIIIISGCAKGADALGERYAKERGLQVERYPARWNEYGKRAGPIRNEEMAKVADAAVLFWDGKSRGTASMMELSKRYGLACRVVPY